MLDLKLINCHVFTENDEFYGDISIKNGKIVSLYKCDLIAKNIIDIQNNLVLPGGVDTHCHLDQPTGNSSEMADNFTSGSKSAVCGGTTTIVPFALQQKGQTLCESINNYHIKSNNNSYCDFSFHVIITDINNGKIIEELSALIEKGYSSYKIYMTYDDLKLNDHDILIILEAISKNYGMTLIHAENDECISWLTNKLISQGLKNPFYHSVSRPESIECEAVYRAATFCEIVNARMLIVHVSSRKAFEIIAEAKKNNITIYAETCPHYLFLSADDLNCDDIKESAKYICSPPPRNIENQKYVWENIINGNVDIFSSDHAPYCNNSRGKFYKGENPSFESIPNGIPGIETRLALLLSEVINKKNISINEFVKLTSTNPAKLFGLYPRKGTISIGSDADIVVWKIKDVIIKNAKLHHNVDYTPYEGMQVSVWPDKVFIRGGLLFDGNFIEQSVRNGVFIPRPTSKDCIL